MVRTGKTGLATKTKDNGHLPNTPVESILTVIVPRPEIKRINIKVIGTSPLVVHKWSEKAKEQMRQKQAGKARMAREKRDPQTEYEAAFHKDADGDYAFPSVGFKAAAVTACSQLPHITKVFARGAFHVIGEYVKIEGTPHMREDPVRVGNGAADLRYRPEFTEWRATIPVEYNAGAISAEQVLALFEIAGFAVGVGEWRPDRNGGWGRFRLETEDDA